MGRISSKTYIRLHALFQLVLAVYLTFSRESVGGPELVYKVRDKLRIVSPAQHASICSIAVGVDAGS